MKIDEAEMAALAESIGTLVGGTLDPRMSRHIIRESRAKIGGDRRRVRPREGDRREPAAHGAASRKARA
jgi:hypothetical protein